MEFLFGFGFFFPFGILVLGVVVLAVLAIAGRRAAPDPMGRRPMAIYLLSVMFITLLTTAGAAASLGMTVAREAVSDDPVWAITVGTSFAHFEPVPPEAHIYDTVELTGDRGLSQILRAALVGLLAAAIFEFHRRKWRELLRKETGDG